LARFPLLRYNNLVISSFEEHSLMAKKKTRRVPQGSTPHTYSDTPLAPVGKTGAEPGAPAPAPAPARAARPSSAAARTVSSLVRTNQPLSVEYKYVAKDLRRLGFTALAFFAALFATGLIAYFVQR
jgi:hypothetical protein